MSNFLNTRRSINAMDIPLNKRLGRGVNLAYKGKEKGTLTLDYGSPFFSPNDYLEIQTDIGCIGIKINQAEHCLNLFSSVPFVLTPSVTQIEKQEWYIELYNQCLFSSFRALFGRLTISRTPLLDDVRPYELNWNEEASTGTASLLLSPSTLEQMLERQPWQFYSFLDISELILSSPVRLATTRIRYSQLKRLDIGDILIPDRPFFSSEGQGSLRLSNLILQLDFTDNGTLRSYKVTQLHKAAVEELNMYNENEEHTSNETPTHLDEDNALKILPNAEHNNPARIIPETQITLSLCAGEVSLSLHELSQLRVGSTLTAIGEMPGHATLYKGNIAVAHGELVEVDGRLGVQLTQILLNQVPRSEGANT